MESSELPEHLIQLIQSLLTSKQAARTALVSKSWLAAFVTRPNLDFDQADFFRSDGTHDETVPYVWNTMKKYAKSSLKIHSFRICVQSNWNFHYARLIRRALLNGATHLSVQAPLSIKACFSVQARSEDFHVPKKVLESKNLVSLTLKGAVIYNPNQKVKCSQLESLCLEKVVIKTRDLFSRIISACPLIRNLSLSFVRVYREVPVDFESLLLRDLSFSLPVLKDLTLRMRAMRDKEDMLISSPSLEHLEIKLKKDRKWHHRSSRIQGIRFDLPSIRKLAFEGPAGVPLLSLRSNLCVDENISTTAPNHLINQVRAQIKFDYW